MSSLLIFHVPSPTLIPSGSIHLGKYVDQNNFLLTQGLRGYHFQPHFDVVLTILNVIHIPNSLSMALVVVGKSSPDCLRYIQVIE